MTSKSLKGKLSYLGKIVVNLLIVFFSITCIFPVIWMMYSSFKTQKEFNVNILSLPSSISFENYRNALETANFLKYSGNSLFNAVIGVILITIIAVVTSYFISRFEFKGRKFIYGLFLGAMLIPIHSLLVPLFSMFNSVGLYNTRFALIIPYITFGLPTALFLTESFMNSLPKELDEAAAIDGCTLGRTIFTIIMPLCKPILITTGILNFVYIWNEYTFALILLDSDKYKTISLGLAKFQGQYSTDYVTQMAGIVLATLPIIIIYVVFNKKIIEGMTAGAVKG